MPEITGQLLGVTFEGLFKNAILFKEIQIDEIAKKCLEAFASHGLKPRQIASRHGDQAFNYDLSFGLFNGNANFAISAEKLKMDFQNARGAKDLEIIADCVAKMYEHVPLPEIANNLINATVHALFPTVEESEKYLSKFAQPTKNIISGGTIAIIACDSWPQKIKLLMEPSQAYPGALFLAWSTNCTESKITRDMLDNLTKAFEVSISKLDLMFAKQKQ